jgi:hypothetical protein
VSVRPPSLASICWVRRAILHGGADDVVLGLLGSERRARGLGVEAEFEATLVLRFEALLHYLRPHPPGRPILGDLLKEIIVGVEEEREPRGELVYL